jgi:hypothetical protein
LALPLFAGCSPSLQKFAAPPAVVYCGLPNRKRFSASPTLCFAVEKTYLQKYTTHLPDTQGIVTHGVNAFVKPYLIVLTQDSHVRASGNQAVFRTFTAFRALFFPLSTAGFVKNFAFPFGFFLVF